MSCLPQSVPAHLSKANPLFWTPVADNFDWANLDLSKSYAISGTAFIDLANPYGPMGNPFAVVIGAGTKDMTKKQCVRIAQFTRTPETVFIRAWHATSQGRYEMALTVLTPTGKELGACAHGFTGAVQTLLKRGQLTLGAQIAVRTTLSTSARVLVSTKGVISLEFEPQEPRSLYVESKTLKNIFTVAVVAESAELPVRSVGSPKLIIELSPEQFEIVRQSLNRLDYDKLLAFEDQEHINGIHLFCRDQRSKLPSKAMQVNAFLGRDFVVDLATGISAAAQLSSDENVATGTQVNITQYTGKGPTAILQLTKQAQTVRVGGSAVLFNYQPVL